MIDTSYYNFFLSPLFVLDRWRWILQMFSKSFPESVQWCLFIKYVFPNTIKKIFWMPFGINLQLLLCLYLSMCDKLCDFIRTCASDWSGFGLINWSNTSYVWWISALQIMFVSTCSCSFKCCWWLVLSDSYGFIPYKVTPNGLKPVRLSDKNFYNVNDTF